MRNRFALSLTQQSYEQLLEIWPEKSDHFSGEPMQNNWQPVELELEERLLETLPENWLLIPTTGHTIGFSKSGYDKYRNVLEAFGEFLPATFERQDIHLYHCTNLLPALDIEKSQYELGHLCGPVNDFRHLQFKPELLRSDALFATNFLLYGYWITSGPTESRLLDMFIDSHTGFRVTPVWTWDSK